MLTQLDKAIIAKNVLTSLQKLAKVSKFNVSHSKKLQELYSDTIFVNYYKDNGHFNIILTLRGEKSHFYRTSFSSIEHLRENIVNELSKIEAQLAHLSDMRHITNVESGAKEIIDEITTQIKDFLANSETIPESLKDLTPNLNKLNAILFAIKYK